MSILYIGINHTALVKSNLVDGVAFDAGTRLKGTSPSKQCSATPEHVLIQMYGVILWELVIGSFIYLGMAVSTVVVKINNMTNDSLIALMTGP